VSGQALLRASVERVFRLVMLDDVLDISSSEGGNLPVSVEAVPVAELLRDAMELAGPLARTAGCICDRSPGLPPGLCVAADRQRLRQVLLNIPIVVLSADATAHHVDQLLAAGIKAYLTKPITVSTFLHTIDRILETPIPTSSGLPGSRPTPPEVHR